MEKRTIKIKRKINGKTAEFVIEYLGDRQFLYDWIIVLINSLFFLNELSTIRLQKFLDIESKQEILTVNSYSGFLALLFFFGGLFYYIFRQRNLKYSGIKAFLYAIFVFSPFLILFFSHFSYFHLPFLFFYILIILYSFCIFIILSNPVNQKTLNEIRKKTQEMLKDNEA